MTVSYNTKNDREQVGNKTITTDGRGKQHKGKINELEIALLYITPFSCSSCTA
jgi:hypothetical protein